MDAPQEQLLHKPEVLARMGYSHATLYARIADGLFPRQIKIGPRRSAWPASEVDAMIAAHVRGETEDQLRATVRRLHAARARAGLDDQRLAA